MPDPVTKVVSQVFGVPAAELTDADNPDTIGTWTSIAHVHLIMALQDEFGVSIDPDDAVEMLSVGMIRLVLAEKGIAG